MPPCAHCTRPLSATLSVFRRQDALPGFKVAITDFKLIILHPIKTKNREVTFVLLGIKYIINVHRKKTEVKKTRLPNREPTFTFTTSVLCHTKIYYS